MIQKNRLPRHIAIVMDGNGRWAELRRLPRITGHRAGIESVRQVIKTCVKEGIEALTLFAFSSENWQRPEQEVNDLMEIFITAFKTELKKLHKNNIHLRIVGDHSRFNLHLQEWIQKAEQLTHHNSGLKLIIAANYGGRWDVTQAMQRIGKRLLDGQIALTEINSDLISSQLSLADLPDPDLFIRTSGEQRISNFLIWQLAYSELYFTDILWPDFGENEFKAALFYYATRQRRFGQTGEQIQVQEE
jgi:undecaprenyl diphosphate synthase